MTDQLSCHTYSTYSCTYMRGGGEMKKKSKGYEDKDVKPSPKKSPLPKCIIWTEREHLRKQIDGVCF